jgi:NAD(P)-dependent dehydrogenase (short-subunit alcohol dehydrogenase family)
MTGTGTTVLITGGAGGIGAALTAAFAAAGYQVVLADLHESQVRAAAVAGGPGVRGVAADITDPASVERLLDAAGPLGVLVNNAGLLNLHGPVLELPAGSLEAIFRVNVFGTFGVTQAVARRWVAAGTPGAVVNISSIGARQPTPGMGAYESSKAAVDALTRWSAIELAAHGIRVNAVAPGPVATPVLAAAMPPGSPARQAWTSRIPLGDIAGTDDVAAAALFLAGPAAKHLTGVSLPVDGGQLLT